MTMSRKPPNPKPFADVKPADNGTSVISASEIERTQIFQLDNGKDFTVIDRKFTYQSADRETYYAGQSYTEYYQNKKVVLSINQQNGTEQQDHFVVEFHDANGNNLRYHEITGTQKYELEGPKKLSNPKKISKEDFFKALRDNIIAQNDPKFSDKLRQHVDALEQQNAKKAAPASPIDTKPHSAPPTILSSKSTQHTTPLHITVDDKGCATIHNHIPNRPDLGLDQRYCGKELLATPQPPPPHAAYEQLHNQAIYGTGSAAALHNNPLLQAALPDETMRQITAKLNAGTMIYVDVEKPKAPPRHHTSFPSGKPGHTRP